MNSISRFPTRLFAQSLLWAISFLLPLAQSSIAYAAAPSDLDLSFGNRGVVQTDFNLRLDDASAVLVQPDGRLVVVGTAFMSNADFAVARYNPDGTLDLSFGNNGKSTTNLLLNDLAGAGILQPDGKIVVAGATGQSFGLVRYNGNGSLDLNFGNGGIVLTDLGQALGGIRVVSSLRQPDGKLVVVGSSNDIDICLARYDSDGTMDTSFGTRGIVVIRHVVEGNGASSAVLQTDGKILVGGIVNTKAGAKAAVFRFNSNGTLDSSFDNDGVVVTSLSNSHDRVGELILRASGKIVAVGTSVNTSLNVIYYALIGFNQDGSLDQGFGTGGISRAGNPTTSIVRGAAEQPDGKIVVVGSNIITPESSIVGFQTARFNANGSPDATFGRGGSASFVVNKGYAEAAAVAIQSNGCLVIAGGGRGLQSPASDFTLLRYVGGNSALPATASISGQIIIDGSLRLSGGARIMLTGGSLNSPIYTRANPFGYFRFTELPTGHGYQLTVDSKSYYFFMRPIADVHLIDNVSDLYYVASVRYQ